MAVACRVGLGWLGGREGGTIFTPRRNPQATCLDLGLGMCVDIIRIGIPYSSEPPDPACDFVERGDFVDYILPLPSPAGYGPN